MPTEPDAATAPEPVPEPMVSEGSLIFKEHLERLSVVFLVLLLGGTLFIDSWSWRAVGLALFLVARPISVYIALLGTRTTSRIRGMTGWFGVRGIGSLYYMMYAVNLGLPQAIALELIQFTLIVVTLSILMHGTSVKPLMGYFWRRSKDGSAA
jgi:NhaP-type Na+/H+ or K+/H+ antiporter